ncbi:MAG: hypothetical protein KDD02_24840 [Phaeodactylibacter sp.]|nr:hypothetical protein [Phaeodactylibacter sp.]MCB9300080.1 hypothetical protein [Lewinellaceae bacterium]HQU57628.1 hypothetical protein [Saprospiraceae bacterium]
MSTPKRNLRQLFSRRAREERKKEQKGILPFLWESIKKGVEGGLSGSVSNAVKWLLAIIFVTGGGWLVNELFVNPWENISIEGYVMKYDQADMPLVGATVYVVGRRQVEFETDEKGYYSGQVKVRKKEKTILLSCDYPGYDYFQKPVDIPVDKPKAIRTDFHLQPH